MSDEERDESTDAGGDGGVFGKLPASRPGSRSPRRRGAAEAEAEGPKVASARADTATTSDPPPAGRRAPAEPAPKPATEAKPAEEPAPGEANQEEGRRGGVEDLAWAGIAAAAEAATLGVRLASRAMGAVRDSVDRR